MYVNDHYAYIIMICLFAGLSVMDLAIAVFFYRKKTLFVMGSKRISAVYYLSRIIGEFLAFAFFLTGFMIDCSNFWLMQFVWTSAEIIDAISKVIQALCLLLIVLKGYYLMSSHLTAQKKLSTATKIMAVVLVIEILLLLSELVIWMKAPTFVAQWLIWVISVGLNFINGCVVEGVFLFYLIVRKRELSKRSVLMQPDFLRLHAQLKLQSVYNAAAVLLDLYNSTLLYLTNMKYAEQFFCFHHETRLISINIFYRVVIELLRLGMVVPVSVQIPETDNTMYTQPLDDQGDQDDE